MNWEEIKKGLRWFRQTSTLIGMPITLFITIYGTERFIFTATCNLAGYRCEEAFGASDAMAQYMGQLLDANPGVDIVTKKRK